MGYFSNVSLADDLFEQHLALADRLARRYSFGPAIDDDLRQVARTGLLLAARRFDPALGHFSRFAVVTVNGELKKHLRQNGWAVRVPRSLQEDSITVAAAVDRLSTRVGRSPTVDDVAEHTGFDRERVLEAMRAREARFTTSTEHAHIDVADIATTADSALVRHAIGRLSDDERTLISYRFFDGLTQAEIGLKIGISQPQVYRRLAAAIERLRTELGDGSRTSMTGRP